MIISIFFVLPTIGIEIYNDNSKVLMKKKLKLIKKRYQAGIRFLDDPKHIEVNQKSLKEISKRPFRYDVINFLLTLLERETTYLEIGVRDPKLNFNKINAEVKYSVDPGIELKGMRIDFEMTSDIFFNKLRNNEVLSKDVRFDVIFIDGLHLAEQVDRDIINALEFIKEDGFIVLHDCNPPTEYHASEDYSYRLSPSKDYWNGTTWKAFYKHRKNLGELSCCIDTDWGIGVISKTIKLGTVCKVENPFYEFKVFEKYRTESLNLISFDEFKRKFS